MPKVEIVYFTGCPLIDRARKALREAGFSNFAEVNLDRLPQNHPYKQVSSPSIMLDGKLVAGTRSGSGACTILDWDGLPAVLRSLVKP